MVVTLSGACVAHAADDRPFAKTQKIGGDGCLVRIRAQELARAEAALESARPPEPVMPQPAQNIRRLMLGEYADDAPTPRAPIPVRINGGAMIAADEVVVGPISFHAPEVKYTPDFMRRKEEMAKTQQFGPVGAVQAPSVDAVPSVVDQAAAAWHVTKEGTLEFHMPLIEEKVAEAWANVHHVAAGTTVKPLGEMLGKGLYKWVYEDPYDSRWVIKVMKPGGAEGRTLEEIGEVAARTASEFRHEREADILMQKLIERHRRKMQTSGRSQITSIEVLEREYPEQAARYASFRERKIPDGAVDFRKLLSEHPELEIHPDFQNLVEFIKESNALKLKHRVDRQLSAGGVYAAFKTQEEAAQSVYCRIFGNLVPDHSKVKIVKKMVNGVIEEEKVIQWEVIMGIDVYGSKNLLVIPEPGNRYRFIFADH